MNWFDFNFWMFSPLSIWVLAAAVFFTSIVCLITTTRLISAVRAGVSELKETNTELRKDTCQLNGATSELNKQLASTTKSVDDWHKTIQRLYFWLPLGGGNK